jgi:hypothetical protein
VQSFLVFLSVFMMKVVMVFHKILTVFIMKGELVVHVFYLSL